VPYGTDWVVLKLQDDPMNFIQITVNQSMVLALDIQGQVYMRIGISEKSPEGYQWLKVLKHLKHISVSLSCQVSSNTIIVFIFSC
jgi:accessory gene regulator protein AgrB